MIDPWQPQRGTRPVTDIGSVAIIGAGVAGLTCARTLLDQGVDVTVFDKGKVPGGRLASGRSPGLDADMGAQYFTVRDPQFARLIQACSDEEVVARWDGRIRALAHRGAPLLETPAQERWVGAPTMSALARRLARDIPIHSSHRVDVVERRAGRYELAGTVGARGVTLVPRDEANEETLMALGDFDVLLVFLPSDQAHPLIRNVSATLADAAARAPCDPCVSLAFVCDSQALHDAPFDGLFVGRDADAERILCWVARDSSKPKRSATDGARWVLHSAPEWSRAHLRDPREGIERLLLEELADLLGIPRFEAKATMFRRWAYARPRSSVSTPMLFDREAKLGLGGDWTAGGRVEGAFLSGLALAQRVLESA